MGKVGKINHGNRDDNVPGVVPCLNDILFFFSKVDLTKEFVEVIEDFIGAFQICLFMGSKVLQFNPIIIKSAFSFLILVVNYLTSRYGPCLLDT